MLQQPEGEGGSPHVLGRRAWAGDARGWLVPCAGDRGMPGPALSPRECPMGARSCPHPWVCRRVSVRGLSTLPWRWGDVPQSSSAADPPPPPQNASLNQRLVWTRGLPGSASPSAGPAAAVIDAKPVYK